MQIDETTYDNVVSLELTGLGLDAFGTESLAVDEGAVGAFHVLDEDLDDGAAGGAVSETQTPGPIVGPNGAERRTLPLSSHTSACCLLRTLESKKPLRSAGTVLALVWRPILTRC